MVKSPTGKDMSDDQTKVLSDAKVGETQPMLETILERVNALASELRDFRQEVKAGFEQVNQRFDEVEKSIRLLERRVDTLSVDVVRVRADQRDIEDRVDKLERKPS
jgi:hypothetical protein